VLVGDPPSSPTEINLKFRLIASTVSHEVKTLVQTLKHMMPPGTPIIGAHVRMLVNLTADIPGIEKTRKDSINGLDRMVEAELYRRNCHIRYFLPKIQEALKKFPSAVVFVASDSQEAIEMSARTFAPKGYKVFHTNLMLLAICRGELRRGAFCSQLALAEFLFLATADVLITSHWSSTTQILSNIHDGYHVNGCRT